MNDLTSLHQVIIQQQYYHVCYYKCIWCICTIRILFTNYIYIDSFLPKYLRLIKIVFILSVKSAFCLLNIKYRLTTTVVQTQTPLYLYSYQKTNCKRMYHKFIINNYYYSIIEPRYWKQQAHGNLFCKLVTFKLPRIKYEIQHNYYLEV